MRGRRSAGALLAICLLAGAGGGPLDPPATAARASVIVPGIANRTSLLIEATYDVRLRLWFATRRLAAVETITFTNQSGGPIDRLELNTVLGRLGGLHVSSASVDGAAVTPRVSDQTLTVPLGGVLPDGASATLRLAFSARFGTRLDGSQWLFAAAGGALAAYRWLPWVSRAHPFDRPNHGDPFVTASSPSVRLTVTTDRVARIATNLRPTGDSADGRTRTFAGTNVRDLTFVADPAASTSTTRAGAVRVIVQARTVTARARLRAQAVRALTRLEAVLGPYPWPTLTVAETRGGYGLESPGAIWIPAGTASANLPWLVAHEIAHQWFYGEVGSDQATQPFADEAPADFLARYVTGTFRGSRCPTAPLDRTIYRYSRACYFEVVYVQGGRLLDDVRHRVGNAAFFGALRGYVAAHRFGFGSTRALIAALDAVDQRDLTVLWRSRFPQLLK
jgi:hypothetical protein